MRKTKYIITLIFLLIFTQVDFGKKQDKISSHPKIHDSYTDVKDDSILLCLADQIVKMNGDIFQRDINSKKFIKEYGQPLHLVIYQNDDYNGAKRYSIYISTGAISDTILPTFLEKSRGVFVMAYLKDRSSKLKKSIPKYFFDISTTENKGPIVDTKELINERSWAVLICRDSRKVNAVEDTFLPFQTIKQFQTFSCDKIDQNSSKIQFEEAIVDRELLRELMNKIPVAK